MIDITPQAVTRIKTLMEKEGPDMVLRLEVLGGGCSGFQYNIKVEQGTKDDDQVFEEEGTKVVVDPVSLDILKGSTLNFKEAMIGSAFVIENPNAASSCGCGNSFSL